MLRSNYMEHKAQRRQERRFLFPRFLLRGLLLVVGSTLLLGCQAPTQQASQSPTQVTGSPTSEQPSKGTPPEVADYVRQHLAQALHLSTNQLIMKLRAGEAIGSLAAQQNLSGDEWHILEITTYQAAYERLVSEGKISSQEASLRLAALRSYSQTLLDYVVTGDCLGGPPPGNPKQGGK